MRMSKTLRVRVRGEEQVGEGDWQALLQVETPANQKIEFYKNSTYVPQIFYKYSLKGLQMFCRYYLVREDDEPHVSPGQKQEPLSQHSTQPQSGWRRQRLAQG